MSETDAVGRVWESGWRDGHLGHVSEALVEIRTPESFRTRAAQRVDATTVAVVGDEIAGFLMVMADELEQVYVAAPHRGSGIAVLLLAEGERQVRENGHEKAWLAVAPGNARARAFYEKRGWIDEGEFAYAAATADGTIDVPCCRYTKSV